MRRSVTLVVLLATAISMAPAAGAPEPLLFADAGQFAVADWLLIGRRHAVNYVAAGARGIPAGSTGAAAEAVVAKLPCDVERHNRYILVRCFGRATAHEIELDQFQVDPLLRTASLRFDSGGHTHEVHWRGLGDTAQPAVRSGAGLAYLEGAAAAARPAAAGGKVFGRRLTFTRDDWAFLDEGAIAVAELFLDEGTVDDNPSFEMTRRFRIPR